jgi:cytochrome c-type biogenesis protein CcmH/NrfF
MDARHRPWAPFSIALAAVATVLAIAGLLLVDRPAPDEAAALFSRVMSPFCPGLLLANCPSPAAEVLRQEIRQAVQDGVPSRTVEADLYTRFGDRIRAEPPASGFGLLAWVIPAALLAASAGWLATWLRHAKRPTEPDSDQPLQEPYSVELRRRLDDELDSL